MNEGKTEEVVGLDRENGSTQGGVPGSSFSRTPKIALYALVLFAVVDTAFLPYLRPLPVTASVGVVLVFLALQGAFLLKSPRQVRLIGLLCAAIVSMLVGVLTYGGAGIEVVLLPVGVFGVFVLYRMFYLATPALPQATMRRFIVAYLTIASILGVLYIRDPQRYFDVRTLFTAGAERTVFTEDVISRFTFIMSDPNNSGAGFCLLALVCVLFCKPSVWIRWIVVIDAGLLVLLTASLTASLMYLAVVVIVVWQAAVRKPRVFVGIVVAGITIVIVVSELLPGLRATVAERLGNLETRFELYENDFTGSRLDIWASVAKRLVSSPTHLFIGTGVPMLDGQVVEPHSGHLHIILAFGLIAYVVFMREFFPFKLCRSWRGRVFLCAALVPFTMNTTLGDYRYVALYAVLLSFVCSWHPYEMSADVSERCATLRAGRERSAYVD